MDFYGRRGRLIFLCRVFDVSVGDLALAEERALLVEAGEKEARYRGTQALWSFERPQGLEG
jgi:hypothetical protein